MARSFTVQDFRDLMDVLYQHPEWREELRRAVLTDQLLGLPDLVQQLAEAQWHAEARLARLEETVAQLAEAQRETEAQVAQLAVAQRETEAQVAQLAVAQRETEAQVAQLAVAQRETEARLARLEETVAQLLESHRQAEARLARMEETVAQLLEAHRQAEARLARLEEAYQRAEVRLTRLEETAAQLQQTVWELSLAVSRLSDRVETLVDVQKHMLEDLGKLKGDMMEIRYRDKAPAYFGSPLFRRVRAVPDHQVADWLEDAIERGEATWDDRKAVMSADLVVRGILPDGEEAYLLVEISWGIGVEDVERAVKQAAVLRKTGRRVIPTVAGHWITEDARAMAESYRVVQITDGRAVWPENLTYS